MNSENLKRRIFQRVESLDQKKLEEIYGLINNHLKGSLDNDWNSLTEDEQLGIDQAIESMNQGEFVSHEHVMQELRKKYA